MKIRKYPENCLKCCHSYYDNYGDLRCSRLLLHGKENSDFICLLHEPKQNMCSNCKHSINEDGKIYCTHKKSKIEVFEYECCRDHTNFD